MDIVLRATVIFFFIFLVTRVVGRRELASLEPFDLILLIVTGDLVQQGVTQNDYSVLGAVTAISTMSGLTVLVSYVGFKWKRIRSVLDGEPVVLVLDGQVLEGNLKRQRMTHDELEAEVRLQQVESVSDVKVAVLETAGNVSVIPKRSS
jgi:uncharacterized membrane protein YcaP (DUF421 family)